MYNPKSLKAEEFISHEEILDTLKYADENKDNLELVDSLLEKAKELKGLTHREASVLLACEDEERIQKMYDLAEQIKKDFYGNRIVMFAPLYLSNYCVNGCVYCPYHLKNKHICRKKLTQEEIKKIWRDMKLRAVDMNRARSLYEAAERSVGVTEGLDSARITIAMILETYERLKANLEEIEARMIALCRSIPAVEKAEKIKGVGIITIACFLAEIGDINRFDSPKQIQKLAGLGLRECSSGKNKGKTMISKRGRALLRKILFQAAMPLVAKNPEFAELHHYYTTREDNPLKKKQSIIAISCKLIRILFVVLKNNVEYDPNKMMNDIKRNIIKAA